MKQPALLICSLLFMQGIYAQESNGKQDSIAHSIGLDEVKVLASYSDRKVDEPVVLSTFSANDISTKLSNQEFPEVLKSAPSIYATKQGGGFGDARITLRGFGSENIGILINGIPVNGMENGSVYWSNWAGLAQVTNSIQVQRGVGLSKLGVSSVGGTINIITQSVDAERGGSVHYGLGNDGYQDVGLTLSTGLTEKGWAVTISGGRTWGDGYVNGTNFEAWNYFANISKRINKDHLLSLTAFGAPQWHNRRSNKQSVEDYENHRDGIRMNTCYGIINGEIVSTYSGYNEYHKPQISLNHFWTINEKSNLSTSVYVSIAKGGGRKVYGKDANRLQYNYKTGKPTPTTDLTPDGLIDYDPVMEDNRLSDHGSDAIFTMGTNAHNWYGFITNYTNNFTEALNFTAGIDFRFYKGFHYDKISDLLGGEYYLDNKLAYQDPNQKLKVGDKVNQDYTSRIANTAGFVQLAYTKKTYKAFVSVSAADYRYQREDPGKYGGSTDEGLYPNSMIKTKWKAFVPVSVKGGFNYKIARIHNVFINGGWMSRAPMMDNIYADNVPIANPITEKIGTVELGYKLNISNFYFVLNGYYTRWMDKSVTKAIGSWNGPKACIPNIDAIHKGIELEASYRPHPSLLLAGAFSLGDWRWANDVSFTLFDEQQNKVGEYNAYIKDLHVGNAPQTSLAVSATWEPLKKLFIGAALNYYGRNYADFAPADRTNPDDRADSWKLPNFYTIDLNMNYKFTVGKLDAILYANVNNLLNKKYISDALDGTGHDQATAVVWYGFGTTWTTGVRVLF